MFPLDCYRRSHDRYSLDSLATVRLNAPVNEEMILKNLSARGVGALGRRALKANDSVEMVITSTFLNEPLQTKAKVVWCKPVDNELFQTGFDFGVDNTIDLSMIAQGLHK